MDIQNKRLSDEEFNRIREEVLTQWPTGKDVDIEEAVAYHKAMPECRKFSKKLIYKNSISNLFQIRKFHQIWIICCFFLFCISFKIFFVSFSFDSDL